MNQLAVEIIIGSTRANRFGPTVATWFAEQARQQPELSVGVLDLAEILAPDEPAPGDRFHQASKRLDAADAFVIVTPEYNHGYPAPLKELLDSTYTEWNAKPVSFVSYGGISGGLRAVEQLKQVFNELHSAPIRETVSFQGAANAFDSTGQPHDSEGAGLAAKALLTQLEWWARALKDARTARPYGV